MMVIREAINGRFINTIKERKCDTIIVDRNIPRINHLFRKTRIISFIKYIFLYNFSITLFNHPLHIRTDYN